MSNYPPLRLAVLTGLVSLKDRIEAEPEFLDTAECPYDNETKGVLRGLLAPKVIEMEVVREVPVAPKNARGRPTKDVKLSDEDQQQVIDTIKETLKSLNAMDGTDADGKELPTSERIAIAKTKTALTDQLLKQMERFTSAQRSEEFRETVLGIMNDFLDEKDRALFIKRLDAFR